MVFQIRQRHRDPTPQLVVAALRIALEQRDGILVRADLQAAILLGEVSALKTFTLSSLL